MRRARRVTGTAALAITMRFTYLIAVYAAPVEPSHQHGAIKIEYSDLKLAGSLRCAAWPVAAIARESCAHFNSSTKIVGVFRTAASQNRIIRITSAAEATGTIARKRSS